MIFSVLLLHKQKKKKKKKIIKINKIKNILQLK